MALIEIDEVNVTPAAQLTVDGVRVVSQLLDVMGRLAVGRIMTDGIAHAPPEDAFLEVHALTRSSYAEIDAANITANTAAANAINPGTHSYEKWQRWHVREMQGSSRVRNFRFYAPPGPTPNTTHQFNGHVVQATYDLSRKLASEIPGRTPGNAPHAVPTTPPAGPNFGVGGVLGGEIRVSPDWSDWVVSQIQTTGGALAGTLLRNRYVFEDHA
jgi:hypothetical protein